MRIHRRRKRGKDARKPLVPEFQANQQIRAETLFVIADSGEQIGELSRADALKLAAEREVDLVVVSPKANPPVAKLMDYGQFKYQKEKEARKQKAQSHQTETKAVRLSIRIGKHDMEVRMNRALEFLNRGDKVKVEVVLRGREKAHGELARTRIKEFIDLIAQSTEKEVNTEQEVKYNAGRLTTVIGLK